MSEAPAEACPLIENSGSTGNSSPPSTKRGRFLKAVLLFFFAFSPAFVCGIFVEENAVNVPVWDDWERATLLERRDGGNLDFAYLNAPHIDHRMLTQRLAVLWLNDLSGGNLRVEIFLSYGMIVLCGLGFWFLAGRVLGGTWAAVTTFVINLILFSPIQYQNFLWAVQLSMQLPLACLGLMVALIVTRWPYWLKTILLSLLAFIGVHSFGHGLILWPVAICLALLMRNFAPMKPRLLCVGILGLLAFADIYCYFNVDFKVAPEDTHSYTSHEGEQPPGLKNALEGVSNPKKLADYFFSATGNVLARLFNANPLDTLKDTGRVIFALFAILSIFMICRWRDDKLWDRLLPWAGVGAYGCFAALAMAIGRRSLSEERVLLTRYITPTMLTLIGIIGMLAVIFHLWISTERSRFCRETRMRVVLILTVFFASLQWSQWVYGVHKMESWKSARLQGRVALIYLNVRRNPDWIGRLDQAPGFLHSSAAYLNGKGFLDPPLASKLDFPPFRLVPQNRENKSKEGIERALSPRAARIQPVRLHDSPVRFKGFALVGHENKRVADGVLLAWRKNRSDSWKVFELAEMRSAPVESTFLDSYFGHSKGLKDRGNYALWQTYIAPEDIPREAREISAWALDAENLIAYEFAQLAELVQEDERSAASEPPKQ